MNNKSLITIVMGVVCVVGLVAAGIGLFRSGPGFGATATPTATDTVVMEAQPTFTPVPVQGVEDEYASTFRFEREGSLLSAIPVSPVHPDTAGHFVQLDEGGAIVAGYVVDNCFTIDTEHYPADAWEYFNGFTGTYHRFLLGEIQTGAPMPDSPPLNTSQYVDESGNRYYWHEQIQDPNNDFWRLDSWDEQAQQCDEDPLPDAG